MVLDESTIRLRGIRSKFFLSFEPPAWENQQFGFWPGLTQTRPYSYWKWLEDWNFVLRKKRYCTIQVAKTKALIRGLCFRICKSVCFPHAGAHLIRFLMLYYLQWSQNRTPGFDMTERLIYAPVHFLKLPYTVRLTQSFIHSAFRKLADSSFLARFLTTSINRSTNYSPTHIPYGINT